MLAVADVAVVPRAPIVTVRSAEIGEASAVRATLTQISPGVFYEVRFRLRDGAVAGLGCVSSASARVQAGSGRSRRLALVPRGVGCAGAGVLRVTAVRPGAAVATARLRVRAAQALGRGDVVGHLLLGPTCPVERADDPCDPVARPAPVALVALDSGGAEAGRTVTLADGSFALDLPAGGYTLHAEGAGAALPRIADTRVVVTAAATRARPQRVVVNGDTGIR
jgi:hypothetical protein